MIYVLAWLCPPLAVLMVGKPGKAIVAALLWCLLWIPGAIYAMSVISETKADKREQRIMRAMQR